MLLKFEIALFCIYFIYTIYILHKVNRTIIEFKESSLKYSKNDSLSIAFEMLKNKLDFNFSIKKGNNDYEIMMHCSESEGFYSKILLNLNPDIHISCSIYDKNKGYPLIFSCQGEIVQTLNDYKSYINKLVKRNEYF